MGGARCDFYCISIISMSQERMLYLSAIKMCHHALLHELMCVCYTLGNNILSIWKYLLTSQKVVMEY